MSKTNRFFTFLLCNALGCSLAQAQENDRLTAEEYVELLNNIDFAAHTLSPAEFLARQEGENVVVFDLRPKSQFDQGHIAGAIHLSPDVTKGKMLTLVPDQDTTILLYCSNSLVPSRMISLTSITLPQLVAFGYENTFMMADFLFGEDRPAIPMTAE